MSGPIYEDDIDNRHRASVIHLALREIADAQGDVDAFVAQYDAPTRKIPKISAEIARRLLAAGRAVEALRIVEAPQRKRSPAGQISNGKTPRIDGSRRWNAPGDAQAARWSCFERFLSARHLRDYLKQLPDFDDIEAERRALDYVENFKSLPHALSFLATWPALDRAAKLVEGRAGELNGDHYEVLTPVANLTAGKYPLAATLRYAR